MQDKWALFQKFLITQNVEISISDLLISSLIIIALSLLLEFTYIKCAKSISNRKMFAYNFLIIAFTTMLIIYIVKSSLALSLGLVGALSIVRFRSAIKEPEELAYLFLTISMGLGLGANQKGVTIIATLIIISIIWIRSMFAKTSTYQSLFLTITSKKTSEITLGNVSEIIKDSFKKHELKRYDENSEVIEISYIVDSSKPAIIEDCKSKLESLSKDINISFIDNKNF